MKRRDFLKSVGMLSLTAAAPGILRTCQQRSADSKQYNVLFIAVDDLRPDLGCYVDPLVHSPNIDRLAKEGMRFDKAYCQMAVCGPSRTAVLTGLRPDTSGVVGFKYFRETGYPDWVTLPQYFKQQGYQTVGYGKVFDQRNLDSVSWNVERYPTLEKNKQYALPENSTGGKATATERVDVPDTGYNDGVMAEEAMQTMEKNKDNPFFLAVGFRKPHLPFSAPEKYWQIYDREEISMPPNPDRPYGAPDEALHNWKELRGYEDIPKEGPLTDEKIKQLRHGYYACISYIDAQVGKLLDKLDELGLRENTIVVLWGDHGYHLGEQDLWCKATNYELDTRVPLIISAPGQTDSGANTDALVEFIDLYPTLMDLCGLDGPDGLEGLSLVPLMEDPRRPWKQAAFSEFYSPPYGPPKVAMGYSIRTDRYRYTEWLDYESWEEQKLDGEIIARELYDHEKDAFEAVNLADQPGYGDVMTRHHDILHADWDETLPEGYRG